MRLVERLGELWRYRELIYNLVIRDLKAWYGDSTHCAQPQDLAALVEPAGFDHCLLSGPPLLGCAHGLGLLSPRRRDIGGESDRKITRPPWLV